MKKAPILFLLLAIISIYSCSNESTPDFTNDWDEDIYFFGENLKENHVDLFFNISETEFDNDITTLRNNTSSFSEEKILIDLSKIISKIGDSHTQLQFTHLLSSLPFRALLLDDGLLLSEIDIGHSQHLGKRITEINDTPIDEVIDRFRSVISYENESNLKNQVVNYLRLFDYYVDFGIAESSSDISIKLEDGSILEINSLSSNTEEIEIASTPHFLQDTESFYWFEELDEDNIIFIKYNACQERSDLSFQSFKNQIANRIDSNDDIDKVVIDLRHNGGGNSQIIKPLIDELEGYLSNNRFTKDQIYVIIGRRTFSSAILNTLELKAKLLNKILGEPSGGKPNHHGEVHSFRLPNSLLNVTYSTKYFQIAPNDPESVFPDIKVDYNSEHFLNGIDPVLELIKAD